jgi:hypothetical protein
MIGGVLIPGLDQALEERKNMINVKTTSLRSHLQHKCGLHCDGPCIK